MPAQPFPPRRRLAAWLVTGPAGHLLAGVADWLLFVGRLASARISRARTAASGRGRP